MIFNLRKKKTTKNKVTRRFCSGIKCINTKHRITLTGRGEFAPELYVEEYNHLKNNL